MAGRYSTVVKDGSNFIGFSGLCQRSDVPGRHKDFKQWWDCTGMELTVFTSPQVCHALLHKWGWRWNSLHQTFYFVICSFN